MRSVNKVILIGNLTRDAETSFTPSGISVSKFSIATNRKWKDKTSDEWKEEVNYTNVVLWRQEALGVYLTKGKPVYVEGRLQTRSYDDKEGRKVYATDVIADEVILLGSSGTEGARPASAPVKAPVGTRATSAKPAAKPGGGIAVDEYEGMGVTDDDLPF